jgi:signal transduction histidine kinase
MQAFSARTDIAELCEEVVEGSVVGKSHIADDIAALSSRPTSINLSADGLGERSQSQALHTNSTKGQHQGVAVLLNFDYQDDWNFITQPGALRRILMNVLGNALKYTESGYIKVRLAVVEPRMRNDLETPSTVFLSVADTGKGISRSFLRSRLFRPFNQENNLSTGCGLGLSIVKSLVASLKGTLEVKSEQGVS